jgi:hypothetical protein
MSVFIWTGTSTLEDLNLANASFVAVMQDVLGTRVRQDDGSLCGELEGLPLLAFRERVQIALGVLRATEPEPILRPGISAIFNDDGTFRQGYLISRLSALLAVVEDAIETHQPVRWA